MLLLKSSACPALRSLVLFLFILTVAPGQERQIPFDTKGTIVEISSGSPYASIWTAEVGPFERLQAFESDTVVVVEIFQLVDGSRLRSRKMFGRAQFKRLQLKLDEALVHMLRHGGEVTQDAIEELRSTFTYDQTGFSSLHGLTASLITESGAVFWIVTGASYFALSLMSDYMDVTPANVEAAKYGHLTGLTQGYLAGRLITSGGRDEGGSDTQAKVTMAMTSLGGIAHAFFSYRSISAPEVDPTLAYLQMSAERHSLLWGMGATLLFLGENPDTRVLTGTALTLSLSSYAWSSPLFGFSRRQMSWADALLADEFMTPWYLTLISATVSLEFETARQAGLLLTAGGIGGYLLGVNLNEGRMRSLGTVKRARLLMYGGALVGLGIAVGTEAKEKEVLWILTATTWLGYFIGGRFGGESPTTSSSWDVKLMPENLLFGHLMRPTAVQPLLQPAPIVQLKFRW